MAMAAMPAIGHAMQDAAPAAPATPAPATGTIQQLFEQSTQATEAADYPRALEILTALEGRVVRNPRSLAIVRVRKAMVLAELSRWAEARDLLNQAAPALPLLQARCTAPLPANDKRADHLRATLGPKGVTPAPVQDSSMLRVLAAADALILRAPFAPAEPAGALVECVDLRALGV